VRKIASRLRPEVLDQLGLTRLSLARRGFSSDGDQVQALAAFRHADSRSLNDRRRRFRIFQELLTNVARHANATRIDVAMRVDSGALVLTVETTAGVSRESELNDSKSLDYWECASASFRLAGRSKSRGPGQRDKVRVCIPSA